MTTLSLSVSLAETFINWIKSSDLSPQHLIVELAATFEQNGCAAAQGLDDEGNINVKLVLPAALCSNSSQVNIFFFFGLLGVFSLNVCVVSSK